MDFLTGRERRFKGRWAGRAAERGAFAEEMDQEYERRLLRQINHQNLPAEAQLAKVTHRERMDRKYVECWFNV